MAGRVWKRGETYHIAFSYKGKEYRKSTLTNKKREAENLLAFYLGQCARGAFTGFDTMTTRYTVAEMLEDLVNDCTVRGIRSVAKVQQRAAHLTKAFGRMEAAALTERQIDLYIKQCPRAPGSVQNELGSLRQAFKIAQRKKLVADMPHIPRIIVNNARQGFFEAEDFDAVMSRLPGPVQDVMRFAYYTGWRSKEITNLEWRFLTKDVLRLPPDLSKNNEGRVVILTGVLAEIIDRRRQVRVAHCPWIFHRKGKPIKDFRRVWTRACTEAGVPDRIPHDFRRTAVRNLTRAGVPEKVAMAITGHKSRSVFDRYNIVNEDDIRQGLEQTFARLESRKHGHQTHSGI